MLRISKRVRNGLIAVAAVIGIGALAIPTIGADFTASDTGSVSVGTANLTVELSDSANTGTFALNFANVKPGDSVVKTFTVKNAGSIKADVSLDQPVTNVVVPSVGAELSKLRVGVDNYVAPVPVTSVAVIPLGSLNAGQSRTYTVRVELDSSAGNVWQGKTLGATGTVWLKQS